MPHFSVESQYCNFETGNWHEDVYPYSEECRSTFLNPRPVHLTFTTDSCIGGLSLLECRRGPCDESDGAPPLPESVL